MPAERHHCKPRSPKLQRDLPTGHLPAQMRTAMGKGNRDLIRSHGLVCPNRDRVRHVNCHGKVMAG